MKSNGEGADASWNMQYDIGCSWTLMVCSSLLIADWGLGECKYHYHLLAAYRIHLLRGVLLEMTMNQGVNFILHK